VLQQPQKQRMQAPLELQPPQQLVLPPAGLLGAALRVGMLVLAGSLQGQSAHPAVQLLAQPPLGAQMPQPQPLWVLLLLALVVMACVLQEG
jgi:hypothetical protein